MFFFHIIWFSISAQAVQTEDVQTESATQVVPKKNAQMERLKKFGIFAKNFVQKHKKQIAVVFAIIFVLICCFVIIFFLKSLNNGVSCEIQTDIMCVQVPEKNVCGAQNESVPDVLEAFEEEVETIPVAFEAGEESVFEALGENDERGLEILEEEEQTIPIAFEAGEVVDALEVAQEENGTDNENLKGEENCVVLQAQEGSVCAGNESALKASEDSENVSLDFEVGVFEEEEAAQERSASAGSESVFEDSQASEDFFESDQEVANVFDAFDRKSISESLKDEKKGSENIFDGLELNEDSQSASDTLKEEKEERAQIAGSQGVLEANDDIERFSKSSNEEEGVETVPEALRFAENDGENSGALESENVVEEKKVIAGNEGIFDALEGNEDVENVPDGLKAENVVDALEVAKERSGAGNESALEDVESVALETNDDGKSVAESLEFVEEDGESSHALEAAQEKNACAGQNNTPYETQTNVVCFESPERSVWAGNASVPKTLEALEEVVDEVNVTAGKESVVENLNAAQEKNACANQDEENLDNASCEIQNNVMCVEVPEKNMHAGNASVPKTLEALEEVVQEAVINYDDEQREMLMLNFDCLGIKMMQPCEKQAFYAMFE